MTEAFERPHHSGWSLDEAKIELRRQVPTERSEVWAAYVEGTMVTEAAYPFDRRTDHPYRRFAEANGFRVAIDEIRRILPLPVDPTLLQTLAAEVRNLQQLAAAGSGRVRVLTCNAETNHHMVDINVRLGFEAVEVAPMLELRIDSSFGPRAEQRDQVSASTT